MTELKAAEAEFTDYFVRNYPGPNTIIGNPHWHAPKIFRAALHAIDTRTPSISGQDRTAWVIEMESDCLSRGSVAYFGVHYWHPKFGFDHDIDQALQFARKQDAEAFKREYKITSGKVTEHMWPEVSGQEVVTEELERLRDVLDTERYKVAIGVQAIARAVQGRQWLSQPGRGSYAYDDERYQQEFGAALTEIEDALRPLQAIAQDWSDCPRDPLRVEANRSAAMVSAVSLGDLPDD